MTEVVMEVEQKTEEKKYDVIGTRPVRPDGVDKVTGKAQYAADTYFPNMLYGAILRSPHGHAKILSIDATEALALDGVKAVVTGEDFPNLEDKIKELGEGAVNIRYSSNNVMAKDKALYYGHAVAAVSATSKAIAQKALKKIKVEYEVLIPLYF